MDYDFHALAAAELESAIAYYDRQQTGLGREFLSEVARAISRIQTFLEASPKVSPRSRRCRTRRFPYGLVYQVRDRKIVILAVMNLRREPGYWRDRED